MLSATFLLNWSWMCDEIWDSSSTESLLLLQFVCTFLALQDPAAIIVLNAVVLLGYLVILYLTRLYAPGPATVFSYEQAVAFSTAATIVLEQVALLIMFCTVAAQNHRFWRGDRAIEDAALAGRERSWRLCSNLLPAPVVAALLDEAEHGEDARAESALAFTFPAVVLLQSDIVGAPRRPNSVPRIRSRWKRRLTWHNIYRPPTADFTSLGERLDPEQICDLLHALFSAYDSLAEWLLVHKLETLGDAVSGLLHSPCFLFDWHFFGATCGLRSYRASNRAIHDSRSTSPRRAAWRATRRRWQKTRSRWPGWRS